MPQKCSVCMHPDRVSIDKMLVAGTSLRKVAEQCSVSVTAMFRHRSEHLPRLLVQAQEAADVANADTLLDQMRSLQRRTLAILDAAEKAGETRTALSAIREVRLNLELLAKLLGELDDRATVNILVAPEWQQVRSIVLAALIPYPDVRVAVAQSLTALEVANGARG